MKKLFISLILCMVSSFTFAQKEVTVKAGTLVPLQIVNPTQASDVKKGQKVASRVSRDINVDGVTAIPYGTLVNGTVYEAKKSSWWGTKGRLGIKISEIFTPEGETIPLTNGDVYVTGKSSGHAALFVAQKRKFHLDMRFRLLLLQIQPSKLIRIIISTSRNSSVCTSV